jgi:hypothetical protein
MRTGKSVAVAIACAAAGLTVSGCSQPVTMITDVAIAPITCDFSAATGDVSALKHVVSAGIGTASVSAYASPDYLVVCTRAGQPGEEATGSGGGTLEPLHGEIITSEQGDEDSYSGSVVGRSDPRVARVEVSLGPGAIARGRVGDGFWAAVWEGTARPSQIIAYDAAGATLDTIKP